MIEITEEANPDGYVEDEDEDFEVNESELESESSYLTSSEEEEQLDKNGKRGECGATPDESEEDDEEEEQLDNIDKNGKRAKSGATPDESEEETEKKVAKKTREILNSLDLTPKTLKSKKRKLSRILQKSKIARLAKENKNRFTFDGANNINSDDESDSGEGK